MNEHSKKIVWVGLFFLLLGFIVFFRKSQKVTESLVQSSSDEPTIQILDADKVQENNLNSADYMKVVEWDRTERKIDMKRTPITVVNGEAILDVEIATKGACFPGDADAIEMELKAAPDHKLLATLEGLSDNGISLQWDVPKDLLTKGIASHQFKLPVKQEPSQYGFFICTANSFDKSCRSKKVNDVNEIFTEHIRKDPNAGKELRNIFFQYFLLDQRGLAAFSSPPKNAQKFEELKKYAKERQMAGDFVKEIETARNNIHTLVSFPFVFNGKKLKIELPQYNLAACAEKTK